MLGKTTSKRLSACSIDHAKAQNTGQLAVNIARITGLVRGGISLTKNKLIKIKLSV